MNFSAQYYIMGHGAKVQYLGHAKAVVVNNISAFQQNTTFLENYGFPAHLYNQSLN